MTSRRIALTHDVWIAVLAIIVSLRVATAAADWPEFRGPAGNGVSTATDVPIEWSNSENIAWKHELPGSGWSSPVVADGRIYLTTATGSADDGDVSLRALCLDLADGSLIWNVEAIRPSAAAAQAMHQKNSLASPTPVVAGDRLYVHFGHMGTAALNLAGNVIWQQTDLTYSPTHGNAGSPVLVDNLLVFSCDGSDQQFVAARDCSTGDVRWRTPRESSAQRPFSFSTPLVVDVDGRQQIVSPASGFVGAYDPDDGREIWRVTYGDGFSVVPRPVFANGLVYVSSGFMRATLLAIDPRGASGDATAANVDWRHSQGVPNTPSMLVDGDEIYFVSDRGVATCLDAHSGREHWSERLGGAFSASPVLAEGRLYFLNEEGVTYVVAADTQYQLLATNDLGERSLASPAVLDGALLIRTEKHLWRIGQ